MSSEIEKYRLHLRSLNLTEQQERELIGAVQCIVESLLNKKYMLRDTRHEQSRPS